MAIAVWFLRKNGLMIYYEQDLKIVKETEKAVMISASINGKEHTHWFPKSVLVEEWEKDVSALGYHAYLVDVYKKAYEEGIIPNFTFTSGRNRYDGVSFIHQETTKWLMEHLDKFGIQYMNKTEWINR